MFYNFFFIQILQDWILVKERKKCHVPIFVQKVNTIDGCADRCAGRSSMFSIGTVPSNGLFHCECYGGTASIDGTCAHKDDGHKKLYKYIPKGMNLHIILKVTAILYISCTINLRIPECFKLKYFRPNYIAA